MSREQEIWDAVEMERVDIMDSDATISFGDAWEQAAGRVMQRMANRIAALEARAETRATDPCTCAGDNGDGSAGFCGHCGGTRQPVAWWIGPHDGLLAGATVNKSLADARIPHGATVRPLVFGDVTASAEARVDADAVINAAREVVRLGNAYMWDTTFEILTTQSWSVLSRGLLDYDMKRAALTGGASDGR